MYFPLKMVIFQPAILVYRRVSTTIRNKKSPLTQLGPWNKSWSCTPPWLQHSHWNSPRKHVQGRFVSERYKLYIQVYISGWWFQPIWKICWSKWESSPNIFEEHHLLQRWTLHLFVEWLLPSLPLHVLRSSLPNGQRFDHPLAPKTRPLLDTLMTLPWDDCISPYIDPIKINYPCRYSKYSIHGWDGILDHVKFVPQGHSSTVLGKWTPPKDFKCRIS